MRKVPASQKDGEESPAPRERSMHTAPAALGSIAARLHTLIDQTLRTVDEHADFETDIAWATAELQAVCTRLERHARAPTLSFAPGTVGERGRPYYVSGVIGGPHHPMTMPIQLSTHDGVSTGQVNLGIAWEGPPGCVHGGYVAHLFDCILGQHNLNVGCPGMTGTLTVRYRRPTPLLTDLRFEVRTAETSGRKVTTEGRIWAGSALCAESEGIFIIPETPPGDAPDWPNS